MSNEDITGVPGLNQLLWYYADMEKKKCIEDMNDRRGMTGMNGRKSSKVMLIRFRNVILSCISDGV